MTTFGRVRKVEGVASLKNLGLVVYADNGEQHSRLMCQLGRSTDWYTVATEGPRVGVKLAHGWLTKALNERLKEADVEADAAFIESLTED